MLRQAAEGVLIHRLTSRRVHARASLTALGR